MILNSKIIKCSFSIVIFLCSIVTTAQVQSFTWAVGYTTGGSSNAIDVCVDNLGNSIVTGFFQGTVDFDPGPLVQNVTATNKDCFIAKYGNSGNLIWVKKIGGNSVDEGHAISAFINGDIIIVGTFGSLTDFNPGPAVFNIQGAGSSDLFCLRLDASGNFIWAKTVGALNFEDATDVAIDNSGNILITGSFQTIVDFDPGPSVFNLTSSSTTFNGLNTDIFILKLTSLGAFVWAKAFVANIIIPPNIQINSLDVGKSIVTDQSGNVYVCGNFYGTMDFDPGPAVQNLISGGNSSRDGFVLKLNAAGNYVWANKIGSITSTDESNTLKMDGNGDIYIGGAFASTVDFDFGTAVYNLPTAGNADAFVLKINQAGNFIYAKGFGTNGTESVRAIAISPANDVYIGGFFDGNNLDLDPGAGTSTVSTFGQGDMFIVRLTTAGNFTWGKKIGGTLTDLINNISVGVSDYFVSVGSFQGTADFDASANNYLISGTASTDNACVFAYTLPLIVLPVELTKFDVIAEGKTALVSWQTQSENNNNYFSVERSNDALNFNEIKRVNSTGNSSIVKNYSITDKEVPEGVFYYRLKQVDLDGSFTFSKIRSVNIQSNSENKLSIINLYPNPASSSLTLNIKGNSTKYVVDFITIHGSKVKTLKEIYLETNSLTVDVSDLVDGFYYLRLSADCGSFVVRTLNILK